MLLLLTRAVTRIKNASTVALRNCTTEYPTQMEQYEWMLPLDFFRPPLLHGASLWVVDTEIAAKLNKIAKSASTSPTTDPPLVILAVEADKRQDMGNSNLVVKKRRWLLARWKRACCGCGCTGCKRGSCVPSSYRG